MQIRNDMEKVRKPSEEWISTYWSEFELSVLLMTVKCIKKLRNSNELMQDWKEVDYSYELCTLMDDYCYVNELSISPRCEEVIPEEEKSVSEYPRIDIKIRWHQHISVIYYAIEAKVLVNKIGIRSYSRASLANEYVINGMRRFVSGKYSSDLPGGIMLGYVLNGTTERLIPIINEKVVKNNLPTIDEIKPGKRFNNIPHYESTHPRDRQSNIHLHHLFAEFDYQ